MIAKMIENLTSDELNKVVENFFAIQDLIYSQFENAELDIEQCTFVDRRDYYWEICDLDMGGCGLVFADLRLFKKNRQNGNIIRETSKKRVASKERDLRDIIKVIGDFTFISRKTSPSAAEISVFYSAKEIKE